MFSVDSEQWEDVGFDNGSWELILVAGWCCLPHKDLFLMKAEM